MHDLTWDSASEQAGREHRQVQSGKDGPPHFGQPDRVIYRYSDGSLHDSTENRQVDVSELREVVCAGRRFRVFHHETGADCTYQVLAELLIAEVQGHWFSASIRGLGALLDTVRFDTMR
jgi:hypothetical protein